MPPPGNLDRYASGRLPYHTPGTWCVEQARRGICSASFPDNGANTVMFLFPSLLRDETDNGMGLLLSNPGKNIHLRAKLRPVFNGSDREPKQGQGFSTVLQGISSYSPNSHTFYKEEA